MAVLALASFLAISLAAPPPLTDDPDGPGDDSDETAPFLGLTLLDAEDLRLETIDDLSARSAREVPPSPLASLLPTLSIYLQLRTAHFLGVASAGATDRLASGTLLLIEAGVPLPDLVAPARRRAPRVLPWQPVREAALDDLRGVEEHRPSIEPSIAEVLAAAERVALVHLDDLAGWRSRARLAAILPDLTADYRRNVGEIDTLGIRSDLGIDSHNLEDVTRYGVRASWQLSQLVFSSQELSAAQAAMDIQRGRQELLAHVTELYYQRLRLLAAPARERNASGERLDLEELTAQIDGLTGGFLSARLAGSQP